MFFCHKSNDSFRTLLLYVQHLQELRELFQVLSSSGRSTEHTASDREIRTAYMTSSLRIPLDIPCEHPHGIPRFVVLLHIILARRVDARMPREHSGETWMIAISSLMLLELRL